MRCEDFRLAAEDRPAGATTHSPLLVEHLGCCADCTRWNLDREAWGSLGELFQAGAESGERVESAGFADRMALRTRVRAGVTAEGRRSVPFWRRPAFGILAAAMMTTVLVVGTSSLQTDETSSGPFSPERPVLLGQAVGAETARLVPAAGTVDPGVATSIPTPEPPEPSAVAPVTPIADDAAPRAIQAAREPIRASAPKAKPSADIRIVRDGENFAVEWPVANETHTVIRSDNPRDFSGGVATVVSGTRWVDSSADPADGAVHYYLID